MKRKTSLPGLGIFLQDIRPGDIRGHQVGRKLNPLELKVHRLSQAMDHERLGQARHAQQKAMPPGEKSRENLLQNFLLADDRFRHLAQYRRFDLRHPLDHGKGFVIGNLKPSGIPRVLAGCALGGDLEFTPAPAAGLLARRHVAELIHLTTFRTLYG